jgi:hypothetical protein
MLKYFHRVLVAFNQFLNVVLLNGLPDETISSHAQKSCEQGHRWGCWVSSFLNLFQSKHGVKAQAGDVKRAKIVFHRDARKKK